MGTFGKWLLGLIILTIAAIILNWFTPWGANKHSAEMGDAVKSSLAAGGFKDVSVNMAGNVAKLAGTVRSAKEKNAAIEIAKGAKCEKCAKRKDTWHEVNGDSITVKKVIPTVLPYTLTGVLSDDGHITLNGYARNIKERAMILAEAEKHFPGKVIDDKIKIAAGAPEGGWFRVARANIAGLGKMVSGEFSMTNGDSILTGKAASVDDRTAINAAISGLPAGFNGATNIVVPNAAAENTGKINSEKICQELFSKLKGDNKINFAYNSAGIEGKPSLALLDTMASAASQCSNFRITVEGHTDSDGSDVYNLDLSQRRAQSVVDYLVAHGVNSANIVAKGFGETTPIASNATAAGKARNRRIEFKVTRSN